MPVFADAATSLASPLVESSVDLLREFERTGRAEPFEAFMRRHASMVYATCLKVTRDPHDAEDATQATFLTLASKSRLNGEIRQPEAWLRKVAHRLSLDLIRSKKRRINRENLRSEMTGEAAPLDSHEHADAGEVKGILHEELAKMPASYRMPLILHYFGGLSRDEMAEQLKLKPSTLGVRLHRAREQLRRKLAARGILLPTVALTALLTEVVRGSVCSHMMRSTAHQASAIAMGHASAPMFAASTGFDSVGSLLNVLAHGKMKLLLSAAILGTAISMSSAQVRALLPEAIRTVFPHFRLPGFSLPRFQLLTPTPQLSAVASGDAAQATDNGETIDVSRPVKFVLGHTLAATIDAMTPVAAATPQAVQSGGPKALISNVAQDKPAARSIPSQAIASAVPSGGSPALRSSSAAGSAHAGSTEIGSAVASAGRSGSSPSIADGASVPHLASSDTWNGIIADHGSSGGGGGGGGGPPADLFRQLPPNNSAALPSDAPARATAAVSGAVPALRDSNGSVAGTKQAPRSSAQSLDGTTFAAATPTEQIKTVLFAGSSANYGGYSDDAWKATQLTHVSSSKRMDAAIPSITDSTAPGYTYNYPTVPGTTLSVNGARLTLHEKAGTKDGAASISFVDTASTAIPALPEHHQFIGLWQLNTDVDFTSVDLLVRYDDLRASRLGLNERILKLWVSDGKSWQLLWLDPTFGRDVDQNLMWVTAGRDVKFFAASAPEPTTLAISASAGLLLLRRRRHP